MNPSRAYRLLAASAALAWLLTTGWLIRSQAPGRLSDFAAFYAGGRLAGTGQLYDAGRLQQIEEESTGRRSPAHGFVRPPFNAILFWPLSQLPFEAAELTWAALIVLSLAGFACLWPALEISQRWVLACVFLPAGIGLANGQDSAVVLLTVAGTVSLHRANRPFGAGMLFSLCAAKAHLFLLLPLLIIRRREHGFGRGLLSGGLLLAAISTVAEGWRWPIKMWRAATDPAFTPEPGLMPNLAGAFSGVPGGNLFYALAAVVIAYALWSALPRASFRAALATTIAASLPLAPHSYLPDCVLLLPAICEAISQEDLRLRIAGYLLATPLPFIAVFLEWPYSSLTAVAIVAFALMMRRSLATQSERGRATTNQAFGNR